MFGAPGQRPPAAPAEPKEKAETVETRLARGWSGGESGWHSLSRVTRGIIC